MSGIAEDGDAVTVPVVHADVVVGGGGDLRVGVDLREEAFGLWREGEDVALPIFERGMPPSLDVVEPKAPEQAEQIVVCASGEKAGELTRVADSLPQDVRIKLRRAFSNEPQRAPGITADARGQTALIPQRGMRAVADQQKVIGSMCGAVGIAQ